MLLPTDHIIIAAACVGLFVVAALLFTFREQATSLTGRIADLFRASHSDLRPCRYCFLGRAHLHEESVRVDGDDLVEVRCWVCRSCGLPQWTVARTAVLKRAA